MSAIQDRLWSKVDIVLRVIDDGAVGRISHSLIKGGSIFGALVTGHSKTGAEYQREHRKRKDAA